MGLPKARAARSRAFTFTWNIYPDNYRHALDVLECLYVCAGEEVAPGTGTPHLQGYVYFANGKTQSASRRLLPGCHIIPALGTPLQNYSYCSKTREEDAIPNAVFYFRGDLPGQPADGGPLDANRWEAAWTCAKRGAMKEIPADIRIRCYSTLRRIERDFMPAAVSLDGPCGLWVWGTAGCGKTLSVTRAYPDAYPKLRNVWWDGYQREPVVILDDTDKYDVKRLTYSCNA